LFMKKRVIKYVFSFYIILRFFLCWYDFPSFLMMKT